jgi:hypothetical protein
MIWGNRFFKSNRLTALKFAEQEQSYNQIKKTVNRGTQCTYITETKFNRYQHFYEVYLPNDYRQN